MFYSEGKACSALLTAASRGYVDILQLRLDSGADIHTVGACEGLD